MSDVASATVEQAPQDADAYDFVSALPYGWDRKWGIEVVGGPMGNAADWTSETRPGRV